MSKPQISQAFRPNAARGLVLILLAALFFSSSGAIAKPAMQAGFAPEQVAMARIVIAALVLLAGTAVFQPSALRVRSGDWRLLAGYGLLGVAGVQLFFFVAASRVPVGVAILLEFTSPVLIALWVRFVRRTVLPKKMWGGIALAMTGLTLVCQVWSGLTLDVVGLLAGVGAAICSAAYFLLGERGVTDRMHPLGVVTWGMAIGGVAMCVVAPPWTLPAATLTAPASFGPWHPPVVVLLVAVALISTVLAYVTGILALRHLPASTASVVGLAEPMIATALAWAFIGEAMTIVQMAGAVVLLTGAAIVQLYAPAKEPVAAAPHEVVSV